MVRTPSDNRSCPIKAICGKTDKFVALAVVIIAVVLVGQILTYAPNLYTFDADAEWQDGKVTFEIKSSGNTVYDALLIDNGDKEQISTLWIYKSKVYDKYFDIAKESLPYLIHYKIDFYEEQLAKSLKIRGFNDVRICDEEQLAELMTKPSEGVGIITYSYELPNSIYSGNAADSIFRWISAGGSLYWVCSEIGGFYSDVDGLHRVSNGQTLFLGKQCINTGETHVGTATDMIDAGGLTKALSLHNSNVLFGMDSSGMDDVLTLGFSASGYSSITMLKSGEGMVSVIGGVPKYYLTDDLAQIIASGLNYSSSLSDSAGGKVSGKISGSFDLDIGTNRTLYVYFGGYFPTYGEAFHE